MGTKLCPKCMQMRECTLIDEGFHVNVYQCDVCKHPFEKEGTGRKALSVFGGLVGGVLALIGVENWADKHHKK